MVIGTFHLFDETRSSLLSSSIVKVHHSFGRTHENRSCVCRNEGFGWTIFAMATGRGDPAPGPPMLRRPWRSRKVRRLPWASDPHSGAEETRTPDVLVAKEPGWTRCFHLNSAAKSRQSGEGVGLDQACSQTASWGGPRTRPSRAPA